MFNILFPLDKAKGYPVGTIRTWKGVKYKKTGEKKWIPVPKGTKGAASEEETKPTGGKEAPPEKGAPQPKKEVAPLPVPKATEERRGSSGKTSGEFHGISAEKKKAVEALLVEGKALQSQRNKSKSEKNKKALWDKMFEISEKINNLKYGKQVYEMTQKEHFALRDKESREENGGIYKDFIGRDVKYSGAEHETRTFNAIHEYAVKHALEAGRKVPNEVLKDYPDMVKQAGEKGQAKESEEKGVESVPKELAEKVKRAEKGKGAEIKLTAEEVPVLLQHGTFGLISAGRNMKHDLDSKLSEKEVDERTQKLHDDLIEGGYKFVKVHGKYGEEEDSYMVMIHDVDRESMTKFGERYNQDSVIYAEKGKNEMIFTTGENKGKRHEGSGYEPVEDSATDYYSEIEIGGKPLRFRLKFDFETMKSLLNLRGIKMNGLLPGIFSLLKGKKMPIGTITHRKGGDYKKLGEEKWRPVPKGKHARQRSTEGGDREFKLHNTTIVTMKKDGGIILDSGGWRTPTTKAHMNTYLEDTPYSVSQEKGTWYVHNRNTGKKEKFEDGMTLGGGEKKEGGTVEAPGAEYAAETKERSNSEIKKLIQEKIKELNVAGTVTKLKTTSFQDLARGSKKFVTIEGWKPDKKADDLEKYAKELGVLLEFKGGMTLGGVKSPEGSYKVTDPVEIPKATKLREETEKWLKEGETLPKGATRDWKGTKYVKVNKRVWHPVSEKSLPDEDEAILKSLNYEDDVLWLNKGKAYPIGTIRHRKGGDYKKLKQGEWQRVPKGKGAEAKKDEVGADYAQLSPIGKLSRLRSMKDSLTPGDDKAKIDERITQMGVTMRDSWGASKEMHNEMDNIYRDIKKLGMAGMAETPVPKSPEKSTETVKEAMDAGMKQILTNAGVDEKYHKSVMEFMADNSFEPDDIKSVKEGPYGYGQTIEVGNEEWAVGDDNEATRMAEENLKSLIDDIGVTGFNKDFWMSHLDTDRLGSELAQDSHVYFDDGHDDPENYIDEEPAGEDGDWTDEQRERAGEASEAAFVERVENDPLEYLEEIYGKDYEGFDLSTYVDEDELIQDAIDVDGRGHGLASYDGAEHEYGDHFFYRMN